MVSHTCPSCPCPSCPGAFARLKPAVHEAVFDACRAASTAELPPLSVRTPLERTLNRVAAAEHIAADCESLKTTPAIGTSCAAAAMAVSLDACGNRARVRSQSDPLPVKPPFELLVFLWS